MEEYRTPFTTMPFASFRCYDRIWRPEQSAVPTAMTEQLLKSPSEEFKGCEEARTDYDSEELYSTSDRNGCQVWPLSTHATQERTSSAEAQKRLINDWNTFIRTDYSFSEPDGRIAEALKHALLATLRWA